MNEELRIKKFGKYILKKVIMAFEIDLLPVGSEKKVEIVLLCAMVTW